MTAVTVERVLGNGTLILRRGSELRGGPRPWLRRWWLAVLRVPLLGKLLGANLLLLIAAAMAHFALPAASMAMQLGITLAASFLVTALLVWLALQPIVQLEATAERVSQGDFAARVPTSAIADRQIAKLSFTMNRLLERVNADRARIQYLAGRSVRARDIERESVARELRESLAQSVAAVTLQITAASAASTDPDVAWRLREIRGMLNEVTDEMRSVAETLYPGTLQAFGLMNAIEALARRVGRRSHLLVQVDGGTFDAKLSPRAASALYRVAEEGLGNVEQHAQAEHVKVTLRSDGDAILEIEDDGRGIDLRLNDPLQAAGGLGLFSARTVLALCGGDIQISSAPGRGTRVTARVPSGRKP